MVEEIKEFVGGDEIEKIKVMEILKKPLINLLKTYPLYNSFGIIEHYFDRKSGEEIVTFLNDEGFLKIEPKSFPRRYRLTPKGVELAMALINLDYSQETHEFNTRIILLTRVLIVLGILTIVITGLPLLDQFFQHVKNLIFNI